MTRFVQVIMKVNTYFVAYACVLKYRLVERGTCQCILYIVYYARLKRAQKIIMLLQFKKAQLNTPKCSTIECEIKCAISSNCENVTFSE